MRRIIGIAGAPGAGKTTYAVALAARLGGVHVPMDGFHLADVALDSLDLRDRKGAPETFDAFGYAALLARLRTETGHTVWAPAFERDLEQPLAGAIGVPADAEVVVTEGNYLLLDTPEWRAVRAQVDECWWVEVDEVVRRARLVARHVRFGKTPQEAEAWVARVDDANAALVTAGRAAADRVVDADELVPPTSPPPR
ncbi:nucleoside/nucleotide kinase family protein [Nocardioides aurantiacus]|uniref:Phosphoribulokinase/uridine kinase family protein n=1 Tax=Nocardioides aurantiacus TaxID=86796 RepID=A0A3N2CRR3_9ACTN|nr:nucleoside/nucleotide kinase family protein [Nocardioides aurantiacus]ROR89954.1 phosphoribulokinase/uridine kinase family protein [Nocardioides aurantiacus]